MKDIFAPGGLIARHHPDYEYRPGQIAMAEAVEEALRGRRHLLVEAGTGTGKTLAYLVPAVAAGQRIIVSTGTKNLQEQLFHKDIPFLQQTLPWKFKASYLKGRSNYLCLNRLGRADSLPMLGGLEEVDHFDVVRRWAAETSTGDRAELAELPENISFWRHIDARSDICIGSQCPSFDPCFITRARQEALDSDIVIVNHHLFFADLALRGRDWGQVLPDYQAVIFDEAHQIEEVASQYFGASVSSFQVEDLIGDITRLAITDVDASREMTRACARVMRFADQFWIVLTGSRQPSGAGPMEGRFQIQPAMFVRRLRDGSREPTSAGESYLGLKAAMERLRAALKTVKDAPVEMEQILRRIEQLIFDLEFVLLGEDDNFVAFCERRGRGVLLQAMPIDASGILEDRLFSKIDTAVLTSATLTSAGSFSFIRQRLGIAEADELVAESNFDYARQTLLYLPPQMPDPRSEHFSEAAASEIIRLLEASRGRAFVLFTSYAQMQTLRRLVEDEVTFPILMQGEGSRGGLLEKFRSTPHAVLFATSSFWQGVDVRGEALSCVIIDKLPFAVPSDPIVAARQRSIDRRGGSSFSEYSVPSAIIALRQGLGRLIRSATDRGILAVLDPRLVTKSYGRSFLESLPPCRTTRSIDEVREFFGDEVAHLRA